MIHSIQETCCGCVPIKNCFSSTTGIVLSWNMELRPFHASVATYQIFAYQGRLLLDSLPALLRRPSPRPRPFGYACIPLCYNVRMLQTEKSGFAPNNK